MKRRVLGGLAIFWLGVGFVYASGWWFAGISSKSNLGVIGGFMGICVAVLILTAVLPPLLKYTLTKETPNSENSNNPSSSGGTSSPVN